MGRWAPAAVAGVAIAVAGFVAATAFGGSPSHRWTYGLCGKNKICRFRSAQRCKSRAKFCTSLAMVRCRPKGCGRTPPPTTGTTTGTTATTTTGSTTSTTTPTPTPTPAPTWGGETDFPAPTFTPLRTIQVSTATDFWKAWSTIQPGDEIDVKDVTFTGEAVFKKQLPDWAEVHFDSGTSFAGTPGSNLPAAWIDAVQHIRFYGGDLTNPLGGTGATVYDSSYFTWWGFTIHDTANTGLLVQGIKTANDHLDLKGDISRWGLKLSLDPHSEKGTGLHGANLADAQYGVRDSRFALHVHDGAAGSGIELGGSNSTDGFWNNTLYLWCQNLTMAATSQVAGNCVQTWGDNVVGNDFAYLEAENLQGRPYDANGMYSGQSLSTDKVDYGRASNTNLNPALASTESGIGANVLWDTRRGTQFLDVAQSS